MPNCSHQGMMHGSQQSLEVINTSGNVDLSPSSVEDGSSDHKDASASCIVSNGAGLSTPVIYSLFLK